MSTNSTIAILNSDGSVNVSYCHFDGYLSGVGKTLKECYNTKELVEELIALGDLSTLGKTANPIGEHSFEFPESDVTIAYHRDRGEDLINDKYDNLEMYRLSHHFQEYNYIFVNGNWFLFSEGNLLSYSTQDEE